MKSLLLLCAVILQALFSCNTPVPNESRTHRLLREFFDHYAQRDDWHGFLRRYDSAMTFSDPILGYEFNNRDGFEAFYNWPDSSFSKHPEYPETLVMQELATMSHANLAIGSGYFTPFYYQGNLYGDKEKMSFTMMLTFNDEGKIVRQVDWIDYPPEIMKMVFCP